MGTFMELRLNQFITGVERITDIHNLDYSNVVLFNMHHPKYVELEPTLQAAAEDDDSELINSNFRMAAGFVEPDYLSLPLNGIWINLYPHSNYYRQALRLVDTRPPNESGVANAITNEGYNATWVKLSRYDQMFEVQQQDTGGSAGPKGPDGDKGLVHKNAWLIDTAYKFGDGVMHNGSYWVAKRDNTGADPSESAADWQLLAEVGDDPDIDYDRILREVKEQLGWDDVPPPL